MNNQRRKRIDGILKDLASLQEAVAKLPSVEDIKTRIEEIGSEEREYYDNMHENLQGGDRGQRAEEAATNLEEAAEETEELGLDGLDDKLSEIVGKLEAARDGS